VLEVSTETDTEFRKEVEDARGPRRPIQTNIIPSIKESRTYTQIGEVNGLARIFAGYQKPVVSNRPDQDTASRISVHYIDCRTGSCYSSSQPVGLLVATELE
jgi:hypothetical protein